MNSPDSANRTSIIQKICHYMNTTTIRSRDKIIKVHKNKILGKGGYSVVFYGTFTDRNENAKKKIDVAIKRTALKKSDMIYREERALKKLNHPNVIRLFYAKSGCIFR